MSASMVSTPPRMRAAVQERYGPPEVVRMVDVAPAAPAEGEVLLAVRAASVNPLDGMLGGHPYSARLMTGLRRPRAARLGVDVAGEVVATGRGVTRFRPGDPVFGLCLDHPGASGVAAWVHSQGAFAEHVCAPEALLVTVPHNVSFEQAAATPVAAITALQGLRDHGRVEPGQRVLVNGAAGGVGTFAVQIARWLGAEVTGVCSTGNVELVRSIGANRVIDYTREEFTAAGARYDVLFDCVANHPLAACRRVLAPGGTYLGVGGPGSRWLIGLVARPLHALALDRFVSQRLVTFLARPSGEDLVTLAGLMEAGVVTPVLDRTYPLDRVAEAMRYQQGRHARGKVVITVP